jgi:membrane-associated phospholipid phosphatase
MAQFRQSLEDSLETMWNFELGIIQFLQNLGTWLRVPMLVFSFFGREEFYLIVMPLIYWCIDSRLGIRISAMVLASNWVNFSLKLAFHSPRPYWVNPTIKAFSSEGSFGMPSGHAQNAAGIWGLLATSLKQRRYKGVLVFCIFFIGFSRLYLGVHFISDVVVGWMLGLLLLWAFIKLEPAVLHRLQKLHFMQHIILSVLLSVVVLSVPLLIRSYAVLWQIPDMWAQNAAALAPDTALDPLGFVNGISLAGLCLGMAFGLSWHSLKHGPYSSKGSPAQKSARYAIGMIGLVIIWAGLDSLFPDSLNLVGHIFRYIRYALLGLWITGLAPFIFRLLGLLINSPKAQDDL